MIKVDETSPLYGKSVGASLLSLHTALFDEKELVCSYRTLLRWVKREELPPPDNDGVKMGRPTLIPSDQIGPVLNSMSKRNCMSHIASMVLVGFVPGRCMRSTKAHLIWGA